MSVFLDAASRIGPPIGWPENTSWSGSGDNTTTCAKSVARSRRSPRGSNGQYARTSEITRAVQALKASGMSVVSVDLRRDGTIRLSSALPPDPADQSEFELWDKAGKL
jgi:hypothetical protein